LCVVYGNGRFNVVCLGESRRLATDDEPVEFEKQ
jgi:hypothetical protein